MYDIIVIGAGPSGSSVANIVASNGYKVLVLEKEQFPRYHIGESLIPFTYVSLQKLNVLNELKQSNFIKKYSVQFVQPDGTENKPFYFYNRYDKDTIAQTWQVDRSKFDKILIDKAVQYGADVKYKAQVDSLLYDEDGGVIGVSYTDLHTQEKRKVYAKWVVDASGRNALVSRTNNWQKSDPLLSNKMAIWTYYEGCDRPEGIDEGATIVAFIQDKGWFWYIPLANDVTSVGVVAESSFLMNGGSDISEAFIKQIENNLWLKNKLNSATRIRSFKCTTDYSKQSTQSVAKGVVLVGDANTFLDPVFSSGVLLALKSGVQVGEIIVQGLLNDNLTTDSFSEYTRSISASVDNMRKLVHAFYNVNVSFKDIINKHPWVADKITDCLSGDLDKDYADLWEIIG